MNQMRESETQRLVGGDLCLDFANTVNGHGRMIQHEYIHDYQDLVLWGGHAGALNPNETKRLVKKARLDTGEAKAVYQKGLELRETVFRIFSALAGGKQPDPVDLERLNAAWREGMDHARLIQVSNGFELGWDDEPCLANPLRLVTTSAVRLLTTVQVQLVRKCSGEGCDWLFVDGSRNHLRKWCSMEECGNRAKMRRRNERKRTTHGSP